MPIFLTPESITWVNPWSYAPKPIRALAGDGTYGLVFSNTAGWLGRTASTVTFNVQIDDPAIVFMGVRYNNGSETDYPVVSGANTLVIPALDAEPLSILLLPKDSALGTPESFDNKSILSNVVINFSAFWTEFTGATEI